VRTKDSERNTAIAITAVGLAIASDSAATAALVISGATKEVGPFTTAVWCGGVGLLLLYLTNRPSLRAGRPIWRRAVLLGIGKAIGSISAQHAIRMLPLAVMLPTTFAFGPMLLVVGEAVRSRRWRDLAWPVIAFFGVVLLAPAWKGQINYWGFAWVAVMSITFLTFMKVMSGLKGPDIDACTTLARIPHILVLVGSAVALEGVTEIVSVSWKDLVVCAVAGVFLSWLPTVLNNAAWQRNLPPAMYALLAPIEPALGALFGLIAGQWPSLAAWFGIGMIAIAAAGGTRTQHRDQPG
jgi:threonine/homoserine efflux transporter RhtA